MTVNAISQSNGARPTQKPTRFGAKDQFSKVLDNLKKNRPADYDESAMRDQNAQTMIQILSDGSTLVTVYDEQGKVISQQKTRAAQSDPEAHIIGTQVETRSGVFPGILNNIAQD